MENLAALGAGLIAGLALALPLGAIGVLLIQQGASRGFGGAVPAAAAVATVDAIYCFAALSAGSVLAPLVTMWMPWPQIVGGVTLVTIAAWGLARIGERPVGSSTSAAVDTAAGWRRYAMFLGLTAVNPATLVYFAAIVTGLSSVTASAAAGALFVVGVTVASLGWQTLLVGVGAVIRGRSGPRLRHATSLIGNGAVALLGAIMIAGAVTAFAP